jgi:hypothetical protein
VAELLIILIIFVELEIIEDIGVVGISMARPYFSWEKRKYDFGK